MKVKSSKSTTRKRPLIKTQAVVPQDSSTGIEKSNVKKQILVSATLMILLLITTSFVILYARGYRLFVDKGAPAVSKTGILQITSTPTSSQVYINDHLTTATNNTINLTPNKYTVKVTKDGYYDFQKDVQIEKEVVTGIDALLFPKSPSLQSISTFGVEEALIDPSGTKLAFKIASQSAKRNGIYILDMTARTVPILQGQSSSSQIANDTVDKFSEAKLSWSPDSKQIIASISALQTPIPNSPEDIVPEPTITAISPTPDLATYFLLKTDGLNDVPQDITATISENLDLWKTQITDREKSRQKSLKPKVAEFSKKYFKLLSWSPDEKKILYQASESAQMPTFLKPRRIGNNLLYERRDIKKGAIYIYDTTEDINTRIVDTIEIQPSFNWFPDSEHLVYVHDKKIQLVDTDGANLTTIYAGPFLGNYVFPWPDGSKIVILTNLGNTTASPTLYTIGLK
mgnify:CR=1 FL=1